MIVATLNTLSMFYKGHLIKEIAKFGKKFRDKLYGNYLNQGTKSLVLTKEKFAELQFKEYIFDSKTKKHF